MIVSQVRCRLAAESIPPGDRRVVPADWPDRAECKDSDPGLWFPNPANQTAYDTAREICQRCVVQGDCLAAALREERDGLVHGMRGGLTPPERRKLLGLPARPSRRSS